MKLALVKASTDVTVYVFIQNSSSTTGAGLTGLVYNSASLTCYYVRPLAAAAQLTLATQTVTGAHSDGGFVEVDATNLPGVYRLDLSDAICATGVPSVLVMLKGAANMAPLLLEIQLTSVNLNDAVRGGMTALPNANAEAAGGLYTQGSGAGQIAQDANGRININIVAAGGSAISQSGGLLNANVTQISGDATAADNAETAFDGGSFNVGGGGIVAASVTGNVGGSVASVTNRVTANTDQLAGQTVTAAAGVTFPTSVASPTNITAGTITTVSGNVNGSVGSVTGNVGGNVTGSVGSVSGNVGGNVVGSIGSLAAQAQTDVEDAVWDATMADHLGSGSTGAALNAAGAAGDPWSTTLPGAYGAGTAGYILGTNLDAAVTSRLAPTVAGRTLDVTAGGAAGVDWGNVENPTTTVGLSGTTISTSQAVASVSGAVGSVTGNVGGNVAGSVGSVTGNVGGNVTGSIGSLGATAQQNVEDAVWDATLADHLDAGSTGAALNAAGAAGDPWSTALPGAYGAGTAGYIVGNRLDAAVSTRLPTSSYTAAPTAAANAAATWAATAESGFTFGDEVRLTAAAAAGGRLSGAATTTVTIRNLPNTKNRIVATVDADGNRTAFSTLDGT